MHNAVAHTNRPMPSQFPSSSPWPAFPLVNIRSMTSCGMQHPFGQFGSAVLAVSPHSFLCPSPASLLVGQYEKLKSSWLSGNTA